MLKPSEKLLAEIAKLGSDGPATRTWFLYGLDLLRQYRSERVAGMIEAVEYTHHTKSFQWPIPLLAETGGSRSQVLRRGLSNNPDACRWQIERDGRPRIACWKPNHFVVWEQIESGHLVSNYFDRKANGIRSNLLVLSGVEHFPVHHFLMLEPTYPHAQTLIRVDHESGRPVRIRELRSDPHSRSTCGSARYAADGELTDVVDCSTQSILWTSRKLTPAWWKAHEASLVAHCAALAARPDAREILIAIGASMSDTVVFPDFAVRLADGRLVRANPPSYPAAFKETDGIIGNMTAGAVKKKLSALWSFTDPRVQVRIVDTERDLALADEIALLDD